MKVTFLGTNGWYDTATGNTPCVFVETENEYIIFDAGFGFYKAKDMVHSAKPVRMFISHLHLDHLIGLHTLPLFKLSQGIDIYAPAPIEKLLRAFLRRPFTSPPFALQTKLRFHRLDKRTRLGFKFDVKTLRHSVPCYGYALEPEGRRITYCTDTGVCRNLKSLASGSDLLITECAMAPDDKSINLFHLTPQSAASIAHDSGARRLALFHFDPGKYPTLGHRKAAEDCARKIFGDSVAANDGTVIEI